MYNNKLIQSTEILRILLISIGIILIIFYFSSGEYIAGSCWIFLVLLNVVLMIDNSQKRGKVNESARKIAEKKIRTRTKNKGKTKKN